MNAPDLFGGEGRMPSAALRAPAIPHQADLFTVAAEASALHTGRALSQVRAEIVHGTPKTAGSGFRCERNHPMRTTKKRGLHCPICDGAR